MRNTKPGELIHTMKTFGYVLHTTRRHIALERKQRLEELGHKATIEKCDDNSLKVRVGGVKI